MNQQNKYDYQELQSYLQGYIQAQVDQDMADPDFHTDPAILWTADDSRLNAINNLQQSVQVIFGNDIYRHEIHAL